VLSARQTPVFIVDSIQRTDRLMRRIINGLKQLAEQRRAWHSFALHH